MPMILFLLAAALLTPAVSYMYYWDRQRRRRAKRLQRRLAKVRALYARAGSPGERVAAAAAIQRLGGGQ